jgi:hypothetical protein
MMRNIIGQSKSAFNLRDSYGQQKNLARKPKQRSHRRIKQQAARHDVCNEVSGCGYEPGEHIPEDDRVDFALYVDEFQNFSTDSFATILSEARKFRLNLIVANQFTTQLTDEIRDAVFGNIGTIVGFRIGQNDVESLDRYFQPIFRWRRFAAYTKLQCCCSHSWSGGVPTQPFSMATLSPLGAPKAGLADALKQLSAAKYGRPKAIVEKEIFARLRSKTPVAPNGGTRPAPGQQPGTLPRQGFIPG